MFSRLVSQRNKVFTILLVAILIFSAFTRVYRLETPSAYYFDEVYHAVTAKLISRDDVRAYEWWNEAPEKDTAVDWLHPPLAKYTQAIGIKMFGENGFGWRISSAVFGVGVVAVTALLAHIAFHSKPVTLIAAFLASLDGLLLAQSRIAMNDIHVTFFIILTAAMYLWYRKRLQKAESSKASTGLLILMGVLAGLSMGSKWSGVFVLAPIFVFEGIWLLTQRYSSRGKRFASYTFRFLTLAVLPVAVYILSYAHMFSQGKTLVCQGNAVQQGSCYCSQESSLWVKKASILLPANGKYFESLEARGGCKRLISHFSELHNQIWWYQTTLKATHPYQSRPWQWALDVKPVWTSVDYSQNDKGVIGNIYNAGNPIIFWGGLIAFLVLGWGVFAKTLRILGTVLFSEKKKTLPQFPLELGFILALYAIVWIPWTFSPRIMFFYHYTPAVPLLCVLIAYGLVRVSKSWKYGHKLLLGYLALSALTFILLFPVFTGYPMSQKYFDTVFSVFPSWK